MTGLSGYAGLILMLPVIMCIVLPLAMLAAYGVMSLAKLLFKQLEKVSVQKNVEKSGDDIETEHELGDQQID